MQGTRKVQMLARAQWLCFAFVVLFVLLKAFAPQGATLTGDIMLIAVGAISANLGIAVAGNVKGDHGAKKNDPSAPPAQ